MPSLHPLHCHGHPPGYGYLVGRRRGAEVYIVVSARVVGEESLSRGFHSGIPEVKWPRSQSTCVEPCKELEGDKSLLGAVEQLHCVHHLLRGNLE